MSVQLVHIYKLTNVALCVSTGINSVATCMTSKSFSPLVMIKPFLSYITS